MATGRDAGWEAQLAAIETEAKACTSCLLCEGRNKVVFGSGKASVPLVFVGEAPGAEEDRQGLPFVGRAGDLLTKIVEAIGLTREQVYIANVLKCLESSAMVRLGDGSWQRIDRLVDSRYDGLVLSVGAEGHLVRRRVNGWHATPLAGRRVFRMTYGSARGSARSGGSIELTGDHPVLTERGYVAVERLRSRDRIATGLAPHELGLVVAGERARGEDPRSAIRSHPAGRPTELREERLEVSFDEVQVREVTREVRADTTFFCIDVEETHNFVTAGGVVHNCRPPGNRDPEPVEIATCAPFLNRQLEVLKPALICCLGRYSTLLLTGQSQAMKNVRGSVFQYRGIPVIPTYHPAALLRNPALKPLVWEDVKKVRAMLDASGGKPSG